MHACNTTRPAGACSTHCSARSRIEHGVVHGLAWTWASLICALRPMRCASLRYLRRYSDKVIRMDNVVAGILSVGVTALLVATYCIKGLAYLLRRITFDRRRRRLVLLKLLELCSVCCDHAFWVL